MLSVLRRLQRRRRRDADAGYTLIEMSAVMAIMSIVLIVIGNVMLSVTRTSTSGEALVANEQQTVLTLTQLARDLRGGHPITFASHNEVAFNQVGNGSGRTVTGGATTVASTTVTASGSSFSSSDLNALISGSGIPANTTITSVVNSGTVTISQPAWSTQNSVTLTVTRLTSIDWRFDPTNLTLTRTVTVGGVTSSGNVMMKRVLNTSGQPVFRYYGMDAANLVGAAPVVDLVDRGLTMTDVEACTTRVTVELHGDANPGPVPFQEDQDVQLRNATGC